MEPDISRPGWLQIQWLSAPNCAAWVRQHSHSRDGTGTPETYAILDAAAARGDSTPASVLAAAVAPEGTLQQGRKWLHGRLGGLTRLPGVSNLTQVRLSSQEAAEVRKLVLRKEQAMMEDLIYEAMHELDTDAVAISTDDGKSAATSTSGGGGGSDFEDPLNSVVQQELEWAEPWLQRGEKIPRVLRVRGYIIGHARNNM